MLLYLVAFAAAQAPAAAANAPATSATPAQLVAAKPEKKKKKRVKYQCDNTQSFTGSYLIPCQAPDPRDLELQQMHGAALLSHAPGDGSAASNNANLPPPR